MVDTAHRQAVVQAGVGRIEEAVKQIDRTAKTAADEARLQKLNVAADAHYRSGGKNAHQNCMDNTRVDLLRDIWKWVWDVAASTPNIFWLRGIAGTGKSTISHTISEQADTGGTKILGGSFFCSRGDAVLSNPRSIFPTVAFQLASFDAAFEKHLIQALADNTRLPYVTLRDQLEELIVGPFNAALPGTKRPVVLVVLDALDECEEAQTRELLTCLVDVKLPIHLKFLITARPEVAIRTVLEPSSPVACPVLVLDIASFQVRADIEHYLDEEFKVVPRRTGLQFSASPEEIAVLTKQAGDLFIVASTAVRFVTKPSSNPRRQLEAILHPDASSSGAYPFSELDRLYTIILNSAIPPLDSNASNFDHAMTTEERHQCLQLFQTVVGMIILLRDPIPISSMERLAGLIDQDVRAALSQLHSVIYVPPLGYDGSPHIHHPSFTDFLCIRCKYLDFFIDRTVHERQLSLWCFSRMEICLTDRFHGHVDPAISNDHVEGLADKVNTAFALDVQYACRHWPSHVSLTRKGDPQVVEALEKFLCKRLIWWIEVMSLLGDLGRAAEGVMDVQRWAVSRPIPIWTHFCTDILRQAMSRTSSSILTLLNDTYRLLLGHMETIASSAPQLYRSVLPFIPSSTELSRIHGSLAEPHLEIVEGRDSVWPAFLAVLPGEEQATALTFSPNGKILAAATQYGTVCIWDAVTGASVARLERSDGGEPRMWRWRPSSFPQTLAFSSDGLRLTSITFDEACLWDMVAHKLMRIVRDPHQEGYDTIGSLSPLLSPSGQRLATVGISEDRPSEPALASLWDWVTGTLVCELKGHSDKIIRFYFSPDNLRLVGEQENGRVCLWNGLTGAFISEFEGPPGGCFVVKFSFDGQGFLAVPHPDAYYPIEEIPNDLTGCALGLSDRARSEEIPITQTAYLRNSETGEVICDFQVENPAADPQVTFSPLGNRLAVASLHGDDQPSLWDTVTGAAVLNMSGQVLHTGESSPFSPDGQRLVAITNDDRAFSLWNAFSGSLIARLGTAHTRVEFHQFSPNGQILAWVSEEGTTFLCHGVTGAVVGAFKPLGGGPGYVHFSPNNRRLLQWNQETMRLWDLSSDDLSSTREIDGSILPPEFPRLPFRFSPDGKTLVLEVIHTPSKSTAIHLWNTETGGRSELGNPTGGKLEDVLFSPSDLRFATRHDATSGSGVCLWDKALNHTSSNAKPHPTEVKSIVFSPNGLRLASGSGSESGPLVLRTSATVVKLSEDTISTTGFAFSPNGERLGSVSMDGTICVWDANTGARLAKWENSDSIASNLTWSPNGAYLAWESSLPFLRSDDCIQIWSCVPEAQVSRVPCQGDKRIVAFSPDSKTLVVHTRTDISLYTLEAGRLIVESSPTTYPGGIVFSPSSNRFVIGNGSDDITYIMDGISGLLLHSVKGGGNYGPVACFSSDSRVLASASWVSPAAQDTIFGWDEWVPPPQNSIVRLWDAEKGTCLRILPVFERYLYSISYSMDGRRLLCSDGQHIIQRFNSEGTHQIPFTEQELSSTSFSNPETCPSMTIFGRRLVLVPVSGQKILCGTIPSSLTWDDHWSCKIIQYYKDTVAIGCKDGRVLVVRVHL